MARIIIAFFILLSFTSEIIEPSSPFVRTGVASEYSFYNPKLVVHKSEQKSCGFKFKNCQVPSKDSGQTKIELGTKTQNCKLSTVFKMTLPEVRHTQPFETK